MLEGRPWLVPTSELLRERYGKLRTAMCSWLRAYGLRVWLECESEANWETESFSGSMMLLKREGFPDPMKFGPGGEPDIECGYWPDDRRIRGGVTVLCAGGACTDNGRGRDAKAVRSGRC